MEEVQVAIILSYFKGSTTGAKGNHLHCLCQNQHGLWQQNLAAEGGGGEKLGITEAQMLRWIVGVTLSDQNSTADPRTSLGIDSIASTVQTARLRWYGYVQSRGGVYLEDHIV